MLYTIIKINEKEYKARLSAKTCVDLEKRLKTNPLNIFIKAGNGELPSLESLLVMLQASLEEYNHGITMDEVYSLYDEYCAGGGNLMSLIADLLEVFKGAGFIPKENDEKNA